MESLVQPVLCSIDTSLGHWMSHLRISLVPWLMVMTG